MKLLVYGSRDFGLVLRELVSDCGHEFAGFIDDVDPAGPHRIGDFAAARASHSPGTYGIVLGIGYKHLEARARIAAAVRAAGYVLPPLVHPAAHVHRTAQVGAGAIVMARALADVRSVLGEACVLWPGANVSHDSAIGAHTFLSPGAIVCGHVRVGSRCFLGAGSVVADHREVPDGTFVKAGTVHA